MNAKDLGELAELRFSIAASEKGYKVSRPIFHNSKYDVILDNGRRLYRVQIKSTHTVTYRRSLPVYEVCVSHGKNHKGSYTKSQIDAVAVYLGRLDLWYLMPVKEIEGKVKITFRPDSTKSKYNKYAMGWDFFK